MFQFLIGKIKSKEVRRGLKVEKMFQFLIGKIKSNGKTSCLYYTSLFQFLIGKIKSYKIIVDISRNRDSFNSS